MPHLHGLRNWMSKIPFFLESKSGLFNWSIFISILVVIILSLESLSQVFIPHNLIMDSIAYWLDPIFFHILSVVIICCLITVYRTARKRNIADSVIVGVSIPVGFLIAELILEHMWLERVLMYPFPRLSLHDSVITSYIRSRLNIESVSSAPSGFCVRQIWLFLLTLGIIRNFKERGLVVNKILKYCAIYVSVIFLLLVVCHRLYVGRTTLFGVGSAALIGVFLFWFLILIYNTFVSFFLQRQEWPEGKDLVSFLTGYAVIVVCIIFYYSLDATRWVLSSLILFFTLGMCYMLGSWRTSKL